MLGMANASQAAAAEQMILEGLKLRPDQATGLMYLGETHAVTGQKVRAVASLRKAQTMCQEMGMD